MRMPDNWPTGAMCNAFTVESGTEIHIGNFAMGMKAALDAAPTPEVESVSDGHNEWRDAMFDASVKREKLSGLTAECFTGNCHHTHGETAVSRTHPAPSDELVKAADEVVDYFTNPRRARRPEDLIKLIRELRTALNKQQPAKPEPKAPPTQAELYALESAMNRHLNGGGYDQT